MTIFSRLQVATQRHIEVLEPMSLNCYLSLFNFASKKAIIIDQIVLKNLSVTLVQERKSVVYLTYKHLWTRLSNP